MPVSECAISKASGPHMGQFNDIDKFSHPGVSFARATDTRVISRFAQPRRCSLLKANTAGVSFFLNALNALSIQMIGS